MLKTHAGRVSKFKMGVERSNHLPTYKHFTLINAKTGVLN